MYYTSSLRMSIFVSGNSERATVLLLYLSKPIPVRIAKNNKYILCLPVAMHENMYAYIH